MLNMNGSQSFYVASEAVDMRKGFNGLSHYIESVMEKAALSQAWFIFFGKRYDRVKIFYRDDVGLCVWYKWLPEGRFRPPKAIAPCYSLSAHELTLLLSGVELTNAQRFSTLRPGLME